MQIRYKGVVSREGDRYLVSFPDAPGCQTFVEPTESVHEVGREALQGWVDAMVESGQELPGRHFAVIEVSVEVPD